MWKTKHDSLKTLLQSKGGIHLTIYVENTGDFTKMAHDIYSSLERARHDLEPIMSPAEIKSLFDPILYLANHRDVLNHFKGHIGLFRTPHAFRALNLPVEVSPLSVVATTFHVKPLLRWLQMDRDFLLVGIKKGVAHLYHGNSATSELVDSFSFDPQMKAKDIAETLSLWLRPHSRKPDQRNFVAGDKTIIRALIKLNFKNQGSLRPLLRNYTEDDVADLISDIRNHIQKEVRDAIEVSIMEFYWAEEHNLASKNLFEIAQAAVQGRIRKLIVADGIHIFGKMDPRTGDLDIHLADMDHEDDDILDDIAQAVLNRGGEVVVTPREHIPKGWPLLAIMNPKTKVQHRFYNEVKELERKAL